MYGNNIPQPMAMGPANLPPSVMSPEQFKQTAINGIHSSLQQKAALTGNGDSAFSYANRRNSSDEKPTASTFLDHFSPVTVDNRVIQLDQNGNLPFASAGPNVDLDTNATGRTSIVTPERRTETPSYATTTVKTPEQLNAERGVYTAPSVEGKMPVLSGPNSYMVPPTGYSDRGVAPTGTNYQAPNFDSQQGVPQTETQSPYASQLFSGALQRGQQIAAGDTGTVIPDWRESLKTDEGFRDTIYEDRTKDGALTGYAAGYGHRLTPEEQRQWAGKTIPQEQLDTWFEQDTAKAYGSAEKQADELGITNPEFIGSLANVNFQLGGEWNKDFDKTWSLLKDGKYDEAAAEVANSDWAKQTPTRVKQFQDAILKLKGDKPINGSLSEGSWLKPQLSSTEQQKMINDIRVASGREGRASAVDARLGGGRPTYSIGKVTEEDKIGDYPPGLKPFTQKQPDTNVPPAVAAAAQDSTKNEVLSGNSGDVTNTPTKQLPQKSNLGVYESQLMTNSQVKNPQIWTQMLGGITENPQFKKALVMGGLTGVMAALGGAGAKSALGFGLAGAVAQYKQDPNKASAMKLTQELGKYVPPEDQESLSKAMAEGNWSQVRGILTKGFRNYNLQGQEYELMKAQLGKSIEGQRLNKELRAERREVTDKVKENYRNSGTLIQSIQKFDRLLGNDNLTPFYKDWFSGTFGKFLPDVTDATINRFLSGDYTQLTGDIESVKKEMQGEVMKMYGSNPSIVEAAAAAQYVDMILSGNDSVARRAIREMRQIAMQEAGLLGYDIGDGSEKFIPVAPTSLNENQVLIGMDPTKGLALWAKYNPRDSH